jgi:leukotriene-A4 hydrolase
MSIQTTTTSLPTDPASLSNFADIITEHIALDWDIDWSNQLIHGSVTLKLKPTSSTPVDKVVLDSSYLEIKSAHVGGKDVKVGEVSVQAPEYLLMNAAI